MSQRWSTAVILVTGAAGKTGLAAIKTLRAHGASVRALVRTESQAEMVRGLGVTQTVVADMRSQAALAEAVQGVGTLYHIGPNMHPHEEEMGHAAIAAALDQDVQHFVYHSVLHPNIRDMPHHWSKMRVEAELVASGLAFTILQPAAYMQNLLGQAEKIRASGVMSLPYPPNTRLALVDLLDVAQAAASVILEPDHQFARYELVGEGALSQLEVAEALSKPLSGHLSLEVIPIETWVAEARKAGMDSERVSRFEAMFRYYAWGGLPGNPRQLARLLGRRPTTIGEFAAREFGGGGS